MLCALVAFSELVAVVDDELFSDELFSDELFSDELFSDELFSDEARLYLYLR